MPPLPRPLEANDVRQLVKVALGQSPAEVIIRGARLVNVFSEQVEPPGAVALARGKVASLGPELPGWLGPQTQVVEAQGQYLIPGLIDAHTHLDAIFTLERYEALALPRGNTTAISETGMIAGAWSWRGVNEFVEQARGLQMRMFHLAPAMCPPYPQFETSAGLEEQEFLSILGAPDCLGMGETYWPSVPDDDPRVGPRFAATQALGKRQGGHAAGARGDKLMAYAASGVSDCHEATTAEEALERLRLGLAVQVREGFVRSEMPAVVPALKDLSDTRLVMLVTDLAPPEGMVEEGVMNVLLRKAVELGVPPARAVAWCSINPASYYRLDRLGAVAPGWWADLALVKDLERFQVSHVWVEGRLAAQDGRMLEPTPAHAFSAASLKTMQSPELKLSDLRVAASGDKAQVRVIQVANPTITKEAQVEMAVRQGCIPPDPERGLLKVAHVNRHSPELKISLGFAQGWGLKRGAAANTLPWDTSNLWGLGASDEELLLALNRARELGGGWVVVDGDQVLAEMPMPICGVTSPEPMETLVAQDRACDQAMRSLGCDLPRIFLTMQTFCFTGLPFLRLTDKGLLDVRRRQMVSLLM